MMQNLFYCRERKEKDSPERKIEKDNELQGSS